MKKIIAILLTLSLMFVFVACGGNGDETPTTDTNQENTTDDQAVNSGDVDVEPSTDENTSDEPSTDENTSDEPESDKADDKEDNKEDESATQKEEVPADPSKWSKEQIVEYYKQSAIKTHPTATSSQTMELQKMVVNDGDGALNFFVNMIKPAIKTVIKNNAVSYLRLGVERNLLADTAFTARNPHIASVVFRKRTDIEPMPLGDYSRDGKLCSEKFG